MGQLNKHHRELTDGVGKCSVPIWQHGVPAGFCDSPAFGEQEEGQKRYGDHTADGRWYPGYCSGLACYKHGGPMAAPVEKTEMDKNRVDAADALILDLLAEGQTSRAEYVEELQEEVRRLRDVIKIAALGRIWCSQCQSYDHECGCDPDVVERYRAQMLAPD